MVARRSRCRVLARRDSRCGRAGPLGGEGRHHRSLPRATSAPLDAQRAVLSAGPRHQCGASRCPRASALLSTIAYIRACKHSRCQRKPTLGPCRLWRVITRLVRGEVPRESAAKTPGARERGLPDRTHLPAFHASHSGLTPHRPRVLSVCIAHAALQGARQAPTAQPAPVSLSSPRA